MHFLKHCYNFSQLLADGEIIPVSTNDWNEEYISRRKILEVLPEKSLVIIASADQQMMTDIPFSFQRPQ
jgi:Xaa-Pro aminopeptidase